MATMRAVRLVGIGQFVQEDVPVRPPNDGEVVVRTERAAICGSDLHVVFMGIRAVPPPYLSGYPGHEAIGTVVESRSPLHREGARVLTCPVALRSQCFAEYQTLAADECLELPGYDGPAEHLLMAQQLGTTIFALRRVPVDVAGKIVMVMGQGSAGNFFAYLLKQMGARTVIASDLSDARLAASKIFGVDVALRADHELVQHTVMELTGGEGVDFLVEAVGTRTALLQSVDLVKPETTMLLFGLPDTEDLVPFNFNRFFRKRLHAYSAWGAQSEPGRVSFHLALDLIAKRAIDITQCVSHRFSLDRIDDAMHVAHTREAGALKVVVTLPGRS